MSADKSSPIEQAYRKEFVAALNLLAQACEVMIKRPGVDFKPVLVDGAAAELMSGGMFTSGDFDFVTPWQEAFEEALIGLGFVRPILPGQISRGLLHPPTQPSVEVVGSRLMDGAADGRRTFEVRIGEGAVRVIGVEDLIADRMEKAGGNAWSCCSRRKSSSNWTDLPAGWTKSTLTAVSATKQPMSLVLKTSSERSMTRSIDIMDLAARLVQRKAELAIPVAGARLMNDGSVRTASKRALLRARDEVARSRGETIVFPANY